LLFIPFKNDVIESCHKGTESENISLILSLDNSENAGLFAFVGNSSDKQGMISHSLPINPVSCPSV